MPAVSSSLLTGGINSFIECLQRLSIQYDFFPTCMENWHTWKPYRIHCTVETLYLYELILWFGLIVKRNQSFFISLFTSMASPFDKGCFASLKIPVMVRSFITRFAYTEYEILHLFQESWKNWERHHSYCIYKLSYTFDSYSIVKSPRTNRSLCSVLVLIGLFCSVCLLMYWSWEAKYLYTWIKFKKYIRCGDCYISSICSQRAIC